MLHPLSADLLDFVAPLIVAVLAFLVGHSFFRWAKLCRYLGLMLTLAVLVLAVLSLTDILYSWSWPSWTGGAAVVLKWAALFILGIVWSAPGRSLSSLFLALLMVLIAAILLNDVGGSLWWRFGAPQLWQRTVDAQGCLQQSTGLTCSPAASVMLLHHYGIDAGEGEMAYLAHTSLLGTHNQNMARAISEKLAARGWHAVVCKIDYESALRAGTPFIAHVDHPRFGPHAIFVQKVEKEQVEVVDPINGVRGMVPREEFQKVWSGTILRVES